MKTKAKAVKERTFIPGRTVHFNETGEYITFEMDENGSHRLVVQHKGVKTVGCSAIYEHISMVKSSNKHVYIAVSEYYKGDLLRVEEAVLVQRGTFIPGAGSP